MSNVLIGVGGSGQHVVLAYLRMMALANPKPSDVPHVYIIDADARVQTGATGDSELCANIRSLHRSLVKSLASEQRAHFALLRPYFQTSAESTPGKVEDNLDLKSCPSWLTDIFLTDETSESLGGAGDRSIDLLQGMMANAKVGAIAFGYKLMRCASEPDSIKAVNFGFSNPETKQGYSLLRDVQRANVAIVGSTFGGTGSGVIPALVRYLASLTSGAPSLVRAFMTLPWFEIDAGDGKSAAATVGNLDPKARNAALGLRSYLSEMSSGIPRSNYLVAQFPGSAAKRTDRGNFNQGEDPHIFNIILATSIQQFLWAKLDTGAISGNGNQRKLFGLITTTDGETEGRFDAAKSSHLRFRAAADKNVSMLDIALEAELIALALEKGADYIRDAAFKVDGADTRAEPPALLELTKLIATSYDKKPLVKRGVIGLRKDVAPNEVYNSLSEALQDVAAVVRTSLLWLDAHKLSNDEPHGAFFPNVGHLFNVTKEANTLLPASEDDLAKRWPAYGVSVTNKQAKGAVLDGKTARIAQAFTLFTNVFFTDEALSQELKTRQENQPDAPIYALVARMLADLVHREVVQARAASRNVALADDKQDEAKPDGKTTAFFKSIQMEIEAESSRTCVIKQGSLNATVGDPGTSSFQSPIQEKHPFSLRYIDPYLGFSAEQNIDLASVSKLRSGDKYFAESALRGIPNVIAPLILHDWRLSQPNAGKAEPLLITPGVRDLKLNEAGLFQHAARVVEAGFWLLFSQDPRVELVETDAETALTSSKIAALINQELRGYLEQGNRGAPNNALPKFVIAFKRSESNKRNEPIKPILIHDPVVGWYLAANKGARQFMTKLMCELPSIQFGNSALEAAWRGNPTVLKATVDTERFETKIVGAFAAYVDQILQSGAVKGESVGWVRALSFTLQVLRQTFPVVSDGTKEIQTVVTGKIVFVGKGGADAPVLLRTPKALAAIATSVFVEQPVYFFVGDERRNAEWGGVWPVTGAAWEFIEPPTDEAHRLPNPMQVQLLTEGDDGAETRSAWRVDSITLNLRELGKREFKNPFGRVGATVEIPGCSDLLQWTAAVWPNFQAVDWCVYYAGGGYFGDERVRLNDFDLALNSLKLDDVELRYFGLPFPKKNDRTGAIEVAPFGLIGTVRYMMPIKLTGRPSAVEIVVGGRVLGSIPIFLMKVSEMIDPTFDLAMDFGTSNTCLAIKKIDSVELPTHLPLLPGEKLPNGLALRNLTAVMGVRPKPGQTDSSAFDRIYKSSNSPVFVFQSFSRYAKDGLARSVPSELIGMRTGSVTGQNEFLVQQAEQFTEDSAIGGKGSVLAGGNESIGQAIVSPHFTPLPPVPNGLDATALDDFLKGGLVKDFKWPLANKSNIPYRTVYIEQILTAAMATLRLMGIRKINRVVATYPGAFEKPYKEKYIQDLNEITSHVCSTTGVTTNNRGVIERSETIAALSSVNPNVYDVCVTIDMGGGTTDVGIIVPGMNDDGSPFGFMSSIRYAGNDLLSALISVPQLRKHLGNADDSDAKRLDLLKLLIRTADARIRQPSAEDLVSAFFEGLYEYVFGLVAAIASSEKFPATGKINVHLFGNGFRLTNAFVGKSEKGFFDAIKHQIKATGMLSPEVLQRIELVNSDGDKKLALIQGALNGIIDASDGAGSLTAQMLAKVEYRDKKEEGESHGRVAIWYPCVANNGKTSDAFVLGSKAERDEIANDPSRAKTLSIDTRNIAKLKKTFPLTHRYWDESSMVDAIFNNAPQARLIALGQYYLEGNGKTASSFARVVLPKIASRAFEKNVEGLRI